MVKPAAGEKARGGQQPARAVAGPGPGEAEGSSGRLGGPLECCNGLLTVGHVVH